MPGLQASSYSWRHTQLMFADHM